VGKSKWSADPWEAGKGYRDRKKRIRGEEEEGAGNI